MPCTPPDITVSHRGNTSSSLTAAAVAPPGPAVARPGDTAGDTTGRTEHEAVNRLPLASVARRGRMRSLWWRSIAACAMPVCALAVAGGGVTATASATPSSSYAASSYTAASSTSTTYPADKKQVCQARAHLKTSIEALKTIPLRGAITTIKADVSHVKTNLNALKTAAKGDYRAPLNAVETSVGQVETAVGKMGNGHVSENLQAVGTAITKMGTTSTALFADMNASCEA